MTIEDEDPELHALLVQWADKKHREEVCKEFGVDRIIVCPDGYDVYSGMDRGTAEEPRGILTACNPIEYGTRKVVMPQARPNDRCPCGSGKKYKKCCMSKGG